MVRMFFYDPLIILEIFSDFNQDLPFHVELLLHKECHVNLGVEGDKLVSSFEEKKFSDTLQRKWS